MSDVKRLSLFDRLFNFKKDVPVVPKTKIGMPRMRQVVKDGLVVNECEFVLDYGPSADLRVDDFALQNLLASGITPEMVGNCDTDSLSLADRVSNSLS